jgi:diaminohydroxyphosphoribosylaminopyrimidine deaminase/5-amino-6-(5-phosphoribosylamino)uracil reductase
LLANQIEILNRDQKYMFRCIELAGKAGGEVRTNPRVGSVLVYGDRIIGEGYHQEYGQPHAEVNCLNSVKAEDRHFIDKSTLYVSLEPCSHFGKTPPCTNMIIQHMIPKVVIGTRDPFADVNGRGISQLKEAGIAVESGILIDKCNELNKGFFRFHRNHSPYVILKWAQTADGYIGTEGARLHITNDYVNRLVHKWRTEEQAILVGTHTALVDDPALTARTYPGPSPLRLVVDMELKLPSTLKLFDGSSRTIVFNSLKHDMEPAKLNYYQLTPAKNLVQQIKNALYSLNVQSLIVEGGAKMLQHFIDAGTWDEARVIVNTELNAGSGIAAPKLNNMVEKNLQQVGSDQVGFYERGAKL